ncbi:hypothetical protein Pcinc_000932 [Petrolisthes cinctipes]|uniref:Uncharacterized protein n=1 Tax=Petrolisthes cinctipes TaxID=88211 RepID=A0AAE1L511_PETCI|nr:hypothetical protein Pcinc_000932 [Petrolisthes cinctipes]
MDFEEERNTLSPEVETTTQETESQGFQTQQVAESVDEIQDTQEDDQDSRRMPTPAKTKGIQKRKSGEEDNRAKRRTCELTDSQELLQNQVFYDKKLKKYKDTGYKNALLEAKGKQLHVPGETLRRWMEGMRTRWVKLHKSRY